MLFPKKTTDNRKKNTKRKISDITKSEVFDRDGGLCVICKNKVSQPEFHHVLYGNEAEYTPDRNNKEKLVTLCVMCHHELHFGGRSTNYREFCINYLKKGYPPKM